jgi:exodeoxyribonuclease V gamma subunit
MIRLHYSNRTDRLIEVLAAQLAEERRVRGPLVAGTVIVPHQALAAHLKLSLARTTGLMANLNFVFLRNFLADVAPEVHLLGGSRFELLLLEILSDPAALSDPALGPVRAYLEVAGHDGPARDLRRSQLARELSRLYDEYVLARADLLAGWTHGKFATGSSIEAFEAALYREVLRRAGPDAKTLADAFDGALRLPPRVHLFQVAVGSPTLKQVFLRLGQATELEIYALNPCLEFWEDVAPGRLAQLRPLELPLRPRAQALDAQEPLSSQADPPALRLWGRPGRESIRLYDDLTDCDFDAHFDEPWAAPGTVLYRLQRDVLQRAPAKERQSDPPAPDDSLQIHACPGVRREAEIIAEQIWALLEARPDLRFHEIAVVLPRRDEASYRAQLNAAFAESHQLPHHHLDVPLPATSRVVEALELLLALPHSRFTRQDLLRLLTHPLVLARFPEANAKEWVEWCEALSLLHGADHHDHEHTYIEKDLYNWDQGLWRIVLGVFMGQDDEAPPVGQGAARYLPLPISFDRLESAASLVTLVRSLLADARFLAQGSRPLSDWITLLRHLLTTYLVPLEDGDERDRQRCLSALDSLLPEGEGPVVGFGIAAELWRSRLQTLTQNTGQPLADGVVIGPLSALHELPFRVVFIPGLGEGRFPSGEQRSQLDLLADERRPGDVSKKERDQYWFLGRLLATQDAVRLSYVARDDKTQDPLGPSSVLLELQYLLESDYGIKPASITIEHPPRRWAEDPQPYAPPGAQREQQMRQLRDALKAHLGEARLPTRDELDAWPPDTRTQLLERLALHPVPRPKRAEAGQLHLAAIRRFLEDPSAGWARFVLDLPDADQDPDPYARSDEHFTTIEPARTILLRESFLLALKTGRPIEEVHAERLLRLELLGSAPTGVFLDAETRRHLEILRGWQKQFLKALGGKPQVLTPLAFGPSREPQVLAETGPALALQIPSAEGPWPLQLRGTSEALLPNQSASFVFLPKSIDRQPAYHPAELRGYLDQLVLAILGRSVGVEHRTYLAFADGLHPVSFLPIGPAEAEAELSRLIAALYAQPHAYRLDFGAIADLHRAQGQPGEQERTLRRVRPSRHELFSVRLDPPELEQARAILSERYQGFFSRRRGPESR